MSKVDFSSLSFSIADLFKLIGLLSIVGATWFDLRVQNARIEAQLEIVNFRLQQLESKKVAFSAKHSRLLSDNLRDMP